MDRISYHSGAGYLWQGFELIRQPKLRRFVIVPLIINIIVFLLIWGIGMHYTHVLIDWTAGHLPHWLQWLSELLWVIFFLVGLLITAYLFTWLANLIASPFYGLLSEMTQHHLKGQPVPNTSIWQAIKEIPQAISRELQKLGYFIPRALLLLIITLIPGINAISGVLWFLFGGWMQTLQYVDYPMDNNRLDFRQVKAFAQQHRMPSLGFGCLTMFLMLIPIVNLITMPAAVCGATALWLDRHKNSVA